MEQTKEYNVYRGFEQGSYSIGNRYMLINNTLIDTRTKTINVVPLTDEELQELVDKLEFAVNTNSTIKFER